MYTLYTMYFTYNVHTICYVFYIQCTHYINICSLSYHHCTLITHSLLSIQMLLLLSMMNKLSEDDMAVAGEIFDRYDQSNGSPRGTVGI